LTDLLLKAVPELARQLPELRVLLVGGGPQEQALRQQAIELGIADRVVFAGRVPHQEVDAYYGLIDLLVYPRHSMRLTELVTPLKPLEAMAQGHLFIASDVGGHQELIPGFGIDVMFQAGQVDALVKCAVNVLKHQEAWPEMRAKGREFVERERNWRKSVSHYQPVYERLVRSSS